MYSKLKQVIKSDMLSDISFKMIANIISTIIKNIMILPVLAIIFSKSDYGEIVTIVGVITTISAGLGNSLLSTRLVMESKYKHAKVEGDFNIICPWISGISMLFIILIKILFPNINGVQLSLIAIILFLETFIGYHSGWFIIKQAYKKLLLYTIIGGVGFFVGLAFSYFTNLWPFTYLLSDLFCFIFLIKFSPLIKEKKNITEIRKTTLQKYGVLVITTVLTNALTYLDRLLLYPIIGGVAVATYTTASMFGKAFSLVAIPVSSIILGYYATGRIKLDLKKYWIINFITLLGLAIFILFTQFFGALITGLLYPRLIEDAVPFIVIANLSSAVGASAQITKSAALKYAKTYWILIIQVVYGTIYIGLGYYLILQDGLRGFSYAVFSANIAQLIMLYVVCHLSIKNNSKAQEGNLYEKSRN